MKSEFTYKYHRRSVRLKDWDYGPEAAYLVTLVAYQRETLFGLVVDEEMKLNDFGKLIYEEWLRTPLVRRNVVLDEFIVMPDHFHGIIMITDNLSKGVQQYALTTGQQGRGVLPYAPTDAPTGKFLISPSNTLGAIIRGFKSASTKRINEIRNTSGVPLWQRNYYDRVIRSHKELDKFRQYIYENPQDGPFMERKELNYFINLYCNYILCKNY